MSRIAILVDLKSMLFPVTLEGLSLLVTTGKGRTLGIAPGPTGALECGSHLEPVELGLVRVALGMEPPGRAAPPAEEFPRGTWEGSGGSTHC